MSLYLGDTLISGAEQFVGESRNIGQIIPSTVPLTDAGLHLLDGALILGGGIYSAFVDYIADLYDSGDYTAIFETEANWQSAVTTYGVCGKFVYDSVANTVRLPKITGFIEGTVDATALGDLVQAGLPNITGQLNNGGYTFRNDVTTNGVFYASNNSSYYPSVSSGSGINLLNFDASRCSSIYGNSTTVQPQTIKVLYYIVVATSTKIDIQVDIDEVVTDLNSKAGTDLTNVNSSGTSLGAGWGMPSISTNLTLGASGTTYTAPANGWFAISKEVPAWSELVLMGSCFQARQMNTSTTNAATLKEYLPVKKGDVVTVIYGGSGTTDYFLFVYAEGSKWEIS